MAQILFGFGGCKFEKDGVTATFSGGQGNIIYRPVQRVYTSLDEDIVSRLIGYHVYLEISELYNVDSDDYLQYQYLTDILGYLVNNNSQETLTITPRDDTTITPLTYTCILDSDFAPEDVHRTKVGQRLSLKFRDISLKTSIPRTVSGTTEGDYWDGTDTYWDGTNTYIDDL